MKKEITFNSLKRFNILMGAFHLFQGILILILGASVDKLGDFKMTIYNHFLVYKDTPDGNGYLDFARSELFSVPFFVLVALFFFICAIAHTIVSIPKKTNNIYNKDLEKGINKFRWFEYALSSSIMICLIAYLFGISDISSLVLIFIVNAAMNLFGLLMEEMNSGKKKGEMNWSPFIYGGIAGIAPWLAIIFYMTGANPETTAQTPWFVWAIVISYFITFNSFPINMILQYRKKGKFQNYLYGERGYIILSLVSKTVLAWLVFAGAMQP